jgi:hypothetical protein
MGDSGLLRTPTVHGVGDPPVRLADDAEHAFGVDPQQHIDALAGAPCDLHRADARVQPQRQACVAQVVRTLGQPPAASRQPPAASRQPPAASRPPPAASRQPPAASRQPPAASRQPPAASRQPPAASREPCWPAVRRALLVAPTPWAAARCPLLLSIQTSAKPNVCVRHQSWTARRRFTARGWPGGGRSRGTCSFGVAGCCRGGARVWVRYGGHLCHGAGARAGE